MGSETSEQVMALLNARNPLPAPLRVNPWKPRNAFSSTPKFFSPSSALEGRSCRSRKSKQSTLRAIRAMRFIYVQKGKIKLTVVSKSGKEAIIGTWSDGDFFGEGCLVGQLKRIGTASAMTECTLMRIEEKVMKQTLYDQPKLSKVFMTHLLSRDIRYEYDLVDQLFNSSEKRLARILLLFARFGNDGLPESTNVGEISQETLAEMAGTTRSRRCVNSSV